MADTATDTVLTDAKAGRALLSLTDHASGSAIALPQRPSVAVLLPIRDLMDRSEREVRTHLRRALDGMYGKPGRELDFQITKVIKERSDCLRITGRVRNEHGVHAGELQRRWYFSQDGRLMVDHLPAELQLHARGREFSGDLGSTLTDYYRRSGVHSIRVLATGDRATEFSRLGARWSSEPADVTLNSHLIRHQISTMLKYDQFSAADASVLQQLRTKFGWGDTDLWPQLDELVGAHSEYSRWGRRIVQNLPLYLEQRL